MQTDFVVALCTHTKNKQKLTDSIVSHLIVDDCHSRSTIDRTDSVLGTLSFNMISKAVCNDSISCCIFLGEKHPLLHLNHLELIQHRRHITALLSGRLDISNEKVTDYSSELLFQISDGLKCYSPLKEVCWASIYTSNNETERPHCYRVDTNHDVNLESDPNGSTMLFHAVSVASAWWKRTGAQ